MKEINIEKIVEFFISQDIFYECQLKEFFFLENEKKFVWIGRPGLFSNFDISKNPYIKITFFDVSNYRRIFQKQKLKNVKFSFWAKNHVGTYESHCSFLRRSINNSFGIEIDLTSLLGRINFNFVSFDVEVKYVKRENDNFYDLDTGEIIDIFKPFP